MKFFSSTQISWCEPYLFVVRIREAWGWRRRILLALGIAVLLCVSMIFFDPIARPLPQAIGISLLAGFVLVALLDMGNIQREVTVNEDSIIVGSNIGRGWFETFKLPDIEGVQLIRHEEWPHKFGGMVIASKAEGFLVAVPNKVSLETLADILHRLGIKVTLSEWEASEGDTRIAVRNELEIDPAMTHGTISITPVEQDEAALMSPLDITIQIIIALGPLLLALIGAIAAGVLLYQNWSDLTPLQTAGYIAGPLVGLIVSFVYLIMAGQFLAASYGISVAKKRLPGRPNSMFLGNEDDLVCVEIFDRQSWTAVVSKSSDYGFLRIDRARKTLFFEGNKFRWTIPTTAITTCRIEESIVGSEADQNAERRYFVVIAAPHNGDTWEAGMVYTRTELGNDTAESRYKRSQLLFSQLADAI